MAMGLELLDKKKKKANLIHSIYWQLCPKIQILATFLRLKSDC
jgi:hypothetical protein